MILTQILKVIKDSLSYYSDEIYSTSGINQPNVDSKELFEHLVQEYISS